MARKLCSPSNALPAARLSPQGPARPLDNHGPEGKPRSRQSAAKLSSDSFLGCRVPQGCPDLVFLVFICSDCLLSEKPIVTTSITRRKKKRIFVGILLFPNHLDTELTAVLLDSSWFPPKPRRGGVPLAGIKWHFSVHKRKIRGLSLSSLPPSLSALFSSEKFQLSAFPRPQGGGPRAPVLVAFNGSIMC